MAWHCAKQGEVEKVYAIPGNPGAAMERNVECMPADLKDHKALVSTLRNLAVDLVLVGPEAPLVDGLMDDCRDAGLTCLGPSRAAAVLEGSKYSMKQFCSDHGIATADWHSFVSTREVLRHLQQAPLPLVVKADGLAAGKGVVVAYDRETAIAAAESMLSGERHGEAGKRVVVESCLQGQEASFIVLTDGENIVELDAAQDHKARDDGDKGPNTGGMGAYSPTPFITDKLSAAVMKKIMRPTVRAMAKAGTPYQGFLYAGLMIMPDGEPMLLEFNCRLGDPETQVILPRLQDNLAMLCHQAATGSLQEKPLRWSDKCTLGVVLAVHGYPDNPHTGDRIEGNVRTNSEDVLIFHAGTKDTGNGLVTAGGRVMCVTALADDIGSAHAKAYQAVERIRWPGMVLRRDIAHRAMQA